MPKAGERWLKFCISTEKAEQTRDLATLLLHTLRVKSSLAAVSASEMVLSVTVLSVIDGAAYNLASSLTKAWHLNRSYTIRVIWNVSKHKQAQVRHSLLQFVMQVACFSELSQHCQHCFPALLLFGALCHSQVSLHVLEGCRNADA